eukprot:scaffold13010_cov26-Tisochrysis_lutea.AAC.3
MEQHGGARQGRVAWCGELIAIKGAGVGQQCFLDAWSLLAFLGRGDSLGTALIYVLLSKYHGIVLFSGAAHGISLLLTGVPSSLTTSQSLHAYEL